MQLNNANNKQINLISSEYEAYRRWGYAAAATPSHSPILLENSFSKIIKLASRPLKSTKGKQVKNGSYSDKQTRSHKKKDTLAK